MFKRNLLKLIIKGLFNLLTRVVVIGMENVPEQGGCIIAVNHMSRIDPPLVYVLLKRRDVSGLAADKYKKNPFFRMIIESINGIWINREEVDFGALREAINYLKKGGILGIAPEGTRSRTGKMIAAKTGIAYLADKARVPVIPTAISGTDRAMHQLFHFKRPQLRVELAEPIQLPPLKRENRDQGLRQNTDEIMCRIAAMLPPQNRGVYAHHPRLNELLENKSSHL